MFMQECLGQLAFQKRRERREKRKERDESCLKVCKSFPEDGTEEQRGQVQYRMCWGLLGYYLGTAYLSTIHWALRGTVSPGPLAVQLLTSSITPGTAWRLFMTRGLLVQQRPVPLQRLYLSFLYFTRSLCCHMGW